MPRSLLLGVGLGIIVGAACGLAGSLRAIAATERLALSSYVSGATVGARNAGGAHIRTISPVLGTPVAISSRL